MQVPMMYGEVKCGYAEDNGIRMVELPYKGDELSMVVILPKFPDGIPAIEKELAAGKLAAWLGMLRERAKLPVSLPRFRIESRFELPPQLIALGMREAFRFGAD